MIIPTRFIGPLLILLSSLCQVVAQEQRGRPNILFIAIDDLRPELGCYGSEIAYSPNLDKLASQGLLFDKAYCQQAICGPSRASLLTGIRPETSGIIHNYVKIRGQNPDVVTLPQHFKNNGYETAYCGKIFHHGDKDDILSWSRKPAIDKIEKPVKLYGGYALPENQQIKKENNKRIIEKYGEGSAVRGLGSSGPAYEYADVPDRTYSDGYNTELAIATMKEMANKDKPFFLGLGFKKPHLNWVAPKKYWDLYDREDIKLSTQTDAPENGAAIGLHPSFELRVRHGIPKAGPIEEKLAITLKHAYLACVSYVDAQIGLMVEALEQAGVRDNTIIIVWSDHGWHLGEMGIWGKATNYEIATRVPMIMWSPTMLRKHRGKKTKALVELVDIYPTLCEMAGLDLPDHLEGQSFNSLLRNPNRKWNDVALSQFPSPALREWGAYPLSKGMRETYFGSLLEEVEGRIVNQQKEKWNRDLYENHLMGYAMRTDRYRLVLWKDSRDSQREPLIIELYDHQVDPFEKTNISGENPRLLNKLMDKFETHWQANHH